MGTLSLIVKGAQIYHANVLHICTWNLKEMHESLLKIDKVTLKYCSVNMEWGGLGLCRFVLKEFDNKAQAKDSHIS